MRCWLALALAAAGCSHSGGARVDLSGRWASAIELHGSDGTLLTLYAIWGAVQADTGGVVTVDDNWQLCNLTLPGPLSVPFDDAGLAQLIFAGTPASLSAPRDGARFTQPNVTMAAQARATASGLNPDADTVDVDFTFTFAFQATVDATASTLDGALTSASLDSRLLDCHLRAGAACSDADVVALEAARPAPAWTGGAIRSHYQGNYFTCPQFLADPDDSLTGREPMDAGALTDGGLGPASFSPIQDDVDFMGCASGGCHETRRAPGQLHLRFQPASLDELRANHDAILPWTQEAGGGRFVNEVPLPAEIRARWMNWIAQGAPF
jgi:hypothetical protein